MTQQTSYGVAVAAVDDSHANERAQRMMTLGKYREWEIPVLGTVFPAYLSQTS